MRPSRSVLLVATFALALLGGCSATGGTPDAGTMLPTDPPADSAACGTVTFDEVRGRPPAYLEGPLNGFPSDAAVCAGWWLPRTGLRFVPQGVVVRGGANGTAWISGYDHARRILETYCRVVRVDLPSGRLLTDRREIRGAVGDRPVEDCRHGGGLTVDRHGLWLTQRTHLWLLDPDTLEVRRAWALGFPVRGSYGTHHGGLIGIGDFDPGAAVTMYWFDPDDLMADGVLDITPALAVRTERAPAQAQGIFRGRLGHGPVRTWFVRSTTRCGVLDGGRGHRLGFVPGAEGAMLRGHTLWVVSESTAAPYFTQGGRPTVPQLVAYDVRRLAGGDPPPCEP